MSKKEHPSQLPLFSSSANTTKSSIDNMHHRSWRDQQRYLPRHRISPELQKEFKIKRQELRNIIGLPVARGKSPYVNNSLYKYLVKQIYKYDKFGIFNDYLSPFPVDKDLQTRINQVTRLIKTMLDDTVLDTKRKKWNYYKQFSADYRQRWQEYLYPPR